MKARMFKVAVVLVLACAVKLTATPVLNSPSLWTDANAIWTVTSLPLSDPFGSGTEVAGGLTTARIVFSGGGAAPAARLSASGTNFTGGLLDTGALSVNFNFIGEEFPLNQTFGSLAMFFQSSNGDSWYYQFTPPSLVGTNYFSANIDTQGTSWFRTVGSGSYLTAIGSVTNFGFEIIGANAFSDQHYGIQDVTFTGNIGYVPEPETVWMIMMVLASLALTFRSRLGELAGQVKARIKA